MTTDGAASLKFVKAMAAISSSLSLKDVLDAALMQYSILAGSEKIAIFLADREGESFRLMAAKGYGTPSLELMKKIPFQDTNILRDAYSTCSPKLSITKEDITGFNRYIFEFEQSVSQLALPLIAGDLFIGLIMIDSYDVIDMAEKEMWNSISSLTASAVANAMIFGLSESARERLHTLYKSLSAFQSSSLSIMEVLQNTANAAVVLANSPYCAILLYESDHDEFRLSAFKGLDASYLSQSDFNNQNNLVGHTLQTGKTQKILVGADLQKMPKGMGGVVFRSALVLPLICDNKKMGVLEIFSADEDAFDQEQVGLLETLASQASNAIYIATKYEQVVEQTGNDPHTGLLSRLYFRSMLRREIERSHRHGREFVICLIDIDYLSRINERLGTKVGDEVIATVAQVIRHNLREIDLVYRYAGQQFVVILPETPRTNTSGLISRLKGKIKEIVIPDVETITVSIGISAYPYHGDAADDLVSLAEDALFVAKYQGRDMSVEAPILTDSGTKEWMTLAAQARQAVSLERQLRIQHAENAINQSKGTSKVYK